MAEYKILLVFEECLRFINNFILVCNRFMEYEQLIDIWSE